MSKFLLIDWKDTEHQINYNFLNQKLAIVNLEINEIQSSLSKISTKVIKGQTFYYKWDLGKWSYEGVDHPKIRADIEIKKLKEKQKKIKTDFEVKIKSCNIKLFKKYHAVCNEKILQFKKHIPAGSLIKISDLKK